MHKHKYSIPDYIKELKKIAMDACYDENFERSFQAISACAQILYKCNQTYKDDELERIIYSISEKTIKFSNWKVESGKRKKILFYDGFGLDRRGIAIVMNKAICLNGYKLIYVSPLKNKDKQPTLRRVLKPFDVEWKFVDNKGTFCNEITQLRDIFEEAKPNLAYFYTYPNDVSGTIVFDALKGKCFRYLLDLTDHAFWLGLNAFDICNGGRQFSASIQHFYRDISLEKISLLDANLYIDDCEFHGLPFDENHRFVFSGGQLYKTLGDSKNTFYKIVEHILANHKDIKFLYAGYGDEKQIRILMEKFPKRIFLISERPDFFQIMERCTFYLNTYPMFGGLMMRYAALAGKLPLTLKHDNDSDGILIEQKKRKIEYESLDDLLEDIDRLLDDKSYLQEREKLLKGAVITEECFVRNIRMMVEEHRTEFSYDKVERVDTTRFRKEYLERFTYEDIVKSIATRRNKKLIKYFPKEFISMIYYKMKKGVCRNDTL